VGEWGLIAATLVGNEAIPSVSEPPGPTWPTFDRIEQNAHLYLVQIDSHRLHLCD
jgi:hypothetical protein